MKKFFIALSVLAALALSVVPSQALVGMPDRVPGNELLQGFFIVAMDQTLDTLVAVQETGAFGRTATAPWAVHWKMYDRSSNHLADRSIPYTRNDVVAISCKDIVFNTLTPNERTVLEADLDTDGTMDHYVGYITWNDELGGVESFAANHLIGKMYVVNLLGGIASGVTVAARETLLDTGWEIPQREVLNIAYNAVTTTTTYTVGALGAAREGFSPTAYATSQRRERTDAASGATFTSVPFFRLLPRWYLYSADGENNVFIWKSFNTVNGATTASWSFSMMVYDNEENPTSKQVNLPQELNIIDVREVVPPDWIPTSGVIAGWFDIRFPSNSGAVGNPLYWQAMDFLAYSWQRATSADATLNWSALFEANREVGTI